MFVDGYMVKSFTFGGGFGISRVQTTEERTFNYGNNY